MNENNLPNGILDSILDAMQILVNNGVANAGYDKTILALIISCEDVNKGKYKIKYLGNSFYAYAENTIEEIAEGSNVYVLVPLNDFTKTKTILGVVTKGSNDIRYITSRENYYEKITINCIQVKDGAKFDYKSFGWFDNKSEDQHPIDIKTGDTHEYVDILYKASIKNGLIDSDEGKLEVNQKEFVNILKGIRRNFGGDSFIFGADFQTNIMQPPQCNGNFGLRITLAVTTDNEIGYELIPFDLDVNKMQGTPYHSLSAIPQRIYSQKNDINIEKLIGVESITLFVKDFYNALWYQNWGQLLIPKVIIDSNDKIPFDIKLSNFELFGARLLEVPNTGTLYLNIDYSKRYFSDEVDTILLKAIIKKNGQEVRLTDSNVEYHWFKERTDVTSADDDDIYSALAGNGWEICHDVTTGDILHTPGIYITKSDVLSESRAYKCIVLYSDKENAPKNSLESTIVLGNLKPQYKINITADKDSFVAGGEESNLTCFVKKDDKQQEVEDYIYAWNRIRNNTYENVISSTAPNKVTCYSNEFNDTITYYCGVYMQLGDKKIYIGSAEKELNYINPEATGYSLLINNVPNAYVYDLYGNAPTINSETKLPVIIKALTATLKDNETNETIVLEDSISNGLYNWFVLNDESQRLIVPNGTPQAYADKQFKITDKDNAYYNVYYGSTFSYTIREKYDIKRTNGNIVILRIRYNDEYLFTSANIPLFKVGDPGVNSSHYFAKIFPFYTNVIVNRHFISDNLNKPQASFTFDQINGKRGNDGQLWFRVLLYKDNEKLFELDTTENKSFEATQENDKSTYTVEWSNLVTLLEQRYSRKEAIVSNVSVDEHGFQYLRLKDLPLKGDVFNKLHNIIKAKITKTDKENPDIKTYFYAYAPLVTIIVNLDLYTLEYVLDSGFAYLKYGNDGYSPDFDNNSPFEIKVYQKDKDVSLDENINYVWEPCGGLYSPKDKDTAIWEKTNYFNLKEVKVRDEQEDKLVTIKNKMNISPNSKVMFDGTCSTVALKCTVYNGAITDENILGYVHIPIYAYINTDGFGSLNDWDGHSIDINKDEGYILAPLIGAGEKDSEGKFTGVLMGTMVDYTKDTINTYKGLLGFNKSLRSIFLDAETGNAEFGIEDSKIKFDVANGNSIIEGGTGTDQYGKPLGMKIILSEKDSSGKQLGPRIEYASLNFMVDKDGKVSCKELRIHNTERGSQGDSLNVDLYPGLFSFYASSGDGDSLSYIDALGNKFAFWKKLSAAEEEEEKIADEEVTEEHDGEKKGEKDKKVSNNSTNNNINNNNDNNNDNTNNNINGDPVHDGDARGISYDNGNLWISGKVTATIGEIGGWLIKSNRIESTTGKLKLYGDGRIIGYEPEVSSTILESYDDDALLRISGCELISGSVETFLGNYALYKSLVKLGDSSTTYAWTAAASKKEILNMRDHEIQGTIKIKKKLSSYGGDKDGNLLINTARTMRLSSAEESIELNSLSGVSLSSNLISFGTGKKTIKQWDMEKLNNNTTKANNNTLLSETSGTDYTVNGMYLLSNFILEDTSKGPWYLTSPSGIILVRTQLSVTEEIKNDDDEVIDRLLNNKYVTRDANLSDEVRFSKKDFSGLITVEGIIISHGKIKDASKAKLIFNDEEITDAKELSYFKKALERNLYSVRHINFSSSTRDCFFSNEGIYLNNAFFADAKNGIGVNKFNLYKENRTPERVLGFTPVLNHTINQDLVGALNEISGCPILAEMEDNGNHIIIKETWAYEYDSDGRRKLNSKTLDKVFTIDVANRGLDNEEVTAIHFPGGFTMNLKNFFMKGAQSNGELDL